jgi:dTDP-4-dehydrorhamnose reductase
MGRVLVLGHTGKLGRALARAFGAGHEVHGCSRSTGFDAGDFAALRALLQRLAPEVVVNAAALNGRAPCDADPALAYRMNSLLPRLLAQCSASMGFLLLHFSTDMVFEGAKGKGPYGEADEVVPISTYGLTKFGGDCYVRAEAERYYVFRLSMLAGESRRGEQFIDRMITRARAGETVRVAHDVACSPSYVEDVAREILRVVEQGFPAGLYHVANAGQATLHELMREILDGLDLKAPLESRSQQEFPFPSRHDRSTPLCSGKLEPLRDWREAIRDYCRSQRGPAAAAI